MSRPAWMKGVGVFVLLVSFLPYPLRGMEERGVFRIGSMTVEPGETWSRNSGLPSPG